MTKTTNPKGHWPRGKRRSAAEPAVARDVLRSARALIRRRFRRLRDELEIPKLCGTATRHTFIKGALQRGVPVNVLAEIVGHVNGRMILNVVDSDNVTCHGPLRQPSVG